GYATRIKPETIIPCGGNLTQTQGDIWRNKVKNHRKMTTPLRRGCLLLENSILRVYKEGHRVTSNVSLTGLRLSQRRSGLCCTTLTGQGTYNLLHIECVARASLYITDIVCVITQVCRHYNNRRRGLQLG